MRRSSNAGWESSDSLYSGESGSRHTAYTGVTSDLCSRVRDHKQGRIPGFTRKYGVKMLVWFEYLGTMDDAIRREKRIKDWRRAWKIALIEETNPHWLDRYVELCGRYIE